MHMILFYYYMHMILFYYYIRQKLIYCIEMYVYSRKISVYTRHTYSTVPYVHYNV